MIIRVKVQPRASRNQLKLGASDLWTLYLTAPPVDNRANEACIRFFSQHLRIPRSSVSIVSGQHSRQKLIELKGIEETELRGIAAFSGARDVSADSRSDL